jgi:hypothetical protein
VQHALDRAAVDGTPPDRRNLLRTIISAAEGISWVCRSHVLSIAEELGETTPFMELAFSEASLFVNERGEIVEQPRYISTIAMIRLTARVATQLCPDSTVDLGTTGWRCLKNAFQTRNRITHPKSSSDLAISDEEMACAKVGFFWFLDFSIHLMEETMKAFSTHVSLAKDLVDRLKAGDPDALALYNRVHQDLGD